MKKFQIFFAPDDGGGAGGGEPAPAPAGDDGAQNTPTAGGGDNGANDSGMKNVFDMGGAANDANAGNQQGAAGDGADEGVPEAYNFKLGEGLEMDDALKDRLTQVAKTGNITQKTMDALMDMHSEVMLAAMQEATKQRNEWANECVKQGLTQAENIEAAKLTVATFGGSEAMDVLVQTGAANHPAVQKMLQNIGFLLREDKPPAGGTAPTKQKPITDLLFGNSQY